MNHILNVKKSEDDDRDYILEKLVNNNSFVKWSEDYLKRYDK